MRPDPDRPKATLILPAARARRTDAAIDACLQDAGLKLSEVVIEVRGDCAQPRVQWRPRVENVQTELV